MCRSGEAACCLSNTLNDPASRDPSHVMNHLQALPLMNAHWLMNVHLDTTQKRGISDLNSCVQDELDTSFNEEEQFELNNCDGYDFEAQMHQEFEKLFVKILGPDYNMEIPKLEDISSPQEKITSNLARWAVECKIPRTHLNKLLRILREDQNLKYLPSDHRSILKSLRRVKTIDMSPDKFYQFSLTRGLSRVLECVPDNEIPYKISIHVNVDGLPMCKSTNGAFWPILVNATNLPVAVSFVCGLHYGPKKPDDLTYCCADLSMKQVIWNARALRTKTNILILKLGHLYVILLLQLALKGPALIQDIGHVTSV